MTGLDVVRGMGFRRLRLAVLTGLLAALLVLAWLASSAHAGDRVYWANDKSSSARISFASLDGSGGGNLSTAGAFTGQPRGVAIDVAAGKVYWTNPDNNRISFANLDGSGGGGDLNTAGATVDRPNAAAVYPAVGKIYWANEFGDRISFANLNNTGGGGNLVTTGATVDVPISPTVDPGSGRIYWGNANPRNVMSWANLNGSGGANINTAGATVDNPHGVAIDPVTSRIYWANVNGQRISWASLSGTGGGNLTTTGATMSTPVGVAIDPVARKIYWGNEVGNKISWANLDGSGGGDLSTPGATLNGSRSPALLQAPQGSGVPTISGGSAIGSVLTCSQGSWAPDLLGQVLYRVPRSFAYSWTLNGASISGANASTYTTAAAGDYRCTVTASNPAGSASQTSAVRTVSPAPPAAPTLNAAAGTGLVHLSWTPGSNGGAAITNYKIYRGTASGGETLLTTVGNVTSYDDTTVTNGTTHYYKVSAVNSVGEGALSNEVFATPTPSISIGDVSAFESNSGQTDFTFAVTLSSSSSQTVTVAYATQNGTATTAGSDYTAASNSITFNPGQTSKTVTIKVNGDTTFETDEGFSVNLSSPSGASLADAVGLGTVRNDDAQPQISVSDVTAAETNSGTTNFTFTLALSNASYQTVTVSRQTQDGTATAADLDYSAQSAAAQSFTPGQTQIQTTIGVNGDAKFEPDETFLAKLTSPANATIADDTGVGTIQNDDAQPQAVVNDVSLLEGDSGTTAYDFTVALSNPSAQTVTVDYASEDGTATTAGGDYGATSGTVTFTSGQTAKTVTVNANGDTLSEPDEDFRAKLTGSTNATVADATGIGTIQNDDPVPALSVSDAAQPEGGAGTSNMPFTVSLGASSGQTVTVDYATQDATATTAGGDYAATSGTLTFTPGQVSKTVDVPVSGDTTTEPDETLTLELTSPVNATIADDTGVGTIQNDDAQPQISVGDVSHVEGATGTTDFAFAVSLSNPSSQTVTVDVATQDGTAAAADLDYQALAPLQVTILPGATQTSVSVTVNGDVTHEPDETFLAKLTSPANATIADDTGVGTIQNDDAQPQAVVNDVSLLEGDSGTTAYDFTVALSNPSAQTVTVDYASEDGTATTAGGDYGATSGTVTFTSGQTAKTVTVNANGDTLSEPDEDFRAKLTGSTNATVADATGIGTIQNDDPVPALSVSDAAQPEGGAGTSNMPFTVSLGASSGQTVTVDYATQDATATTAGGDYAATSGTLTFTPGQVSKTVDVPVSGDTTTEPDETLTLELTSPVNATIADDTGVGTIQNDDAQPQISVGDVSHVEGATGTTDFAFAVSLSNPSSQTVTVDVATQDGTAAAADLDYQALAPLQVTILPGATQTSVSVTVNGDVTHEPDETFLAKLTSPANATIADDTGVGTIQNDDAEPAISVDDVAALEGNSGQADLTFTVSLANPSSEPVSVAYATQDGTAVAGTDYTASSDTLSFDPGQASRQVTVKADGDIDAEANETFTLVLSNAAGATIADATGLGVIQNDDFKYARPKAATPIVAPLVQAYQPCATPNRVHDGTLVPGGSCAPPAQTSPHLTSGTPDANGAVADFVGSVRLRVCSDPACSGADLAIEASLKDVRCQEGVLSEPVCSAPNLVAGADYAGELSLKLSLRITDRASAPAGGGAADQGTVQDIDFPAAIQCAPTLDDSIGGQCDLATTANSLVPGAVTPGSRAIWELGRVEVDDAGPDGSLSTPEGAAPFAVQGVFAP